MDTRVADSALEGTVSSELVSGKGFATDRED
jgi:hypothetical protein